VRKRSLMALVGRMTGLGATTLLIAVAAASPAQAGAVSPRFATVRSSVLPTTNVATGEFKSAAMSIEVVLAPSHEAQLQALLERVYSPTSTSYRHWLAKGQFAKRFAPSRAERAGVARYLASNQLVVERSSSPFLVRAAGSSAAISEAFRTRLRAYVDPSGISYFANAAPVQLPANIAGGVLGVVGLTNTIRARSSAEPVRNRVKLGFGRPSGAGNCETPYVTIAQLVTQFVDGGPPPTLGYGAGPGCSGLTPSQDNSLYDAPNVGPSGQGAGANLAVFELSAYQESDIDTWAHQFYGRHYTPSLINVTVDGGPLNPVCPAGDTCPPEFNGYAGDIEVDADIEMSLAISPENRHIIVYNAPNDETGQTELDEYSAIANQDIADTTSSSWGTCENDVTPAYTVAENLIFEQMAAQGQSLFTSSGDSGAFECLNIDGTTLANVGDPGSQPWITSVGGTSFNSFNPGQNPDPTYPPPGTETVWNPLGLCNTSANEFGQSGLEWCADTGADGGGTSQYWGRPFYQTGPGVNTRFTTYANGTTHCSLARIGTPCREVPDVSMNADQFTPYSEYCTGNANTPNSVCATFSGGQTPPGWFGIGGTSLSSPFMSAIIADRDSFTGLRTGNANQLLYALFNSPNPTLYFHDITSFGPGPKNNGLFPATRGYDLATGIGTAIMAPIITAGR
jgi:subtilase family serine protease